MLHDILNCGGAFAAIIIAFIVACTMIYLVSHFAKFNDSLPPVD